jgi:hypothetical protein
MAQRTTWGTMAAGAAAWLVLLAIVPWRAQRDEATQDQAEAEAARLEEVARDSEDEVFSLRDATGATGDLPAFYEQQWVPLIGVLVPPPERRFPLPTEEELAEWNLGTSTAYLSCVEHPTPETSHLGWLPFQAACSADQMARRAAARKATNEELERARAANTALQARLREMAEYEARAQEVEP